MKKIPHYLQFSVLILFLILSLGIYGCGDDDNATPEENVPEEPLLGAGTTDMAAKAGLAIIGVIAKSECDGGDGGDLACKINYLLNPNNETIDKINELTAKIDKEFKVINDKLDLLETNLKKLGEEINVNTNKIIFSNLDSKLYPSYILINGAKQELINLNGSSNLDNYILAASTNTGDTNLHYDVFQNEMLISGLLTIDGGVYDALYELLASKIDSDPTGDHSKIFQFLEDYYSYSLARQTTALHIIASCYKWKEGMDKKGKPTNIIFLHPDFETYVKNAYADYIKSQTNKYAEVLEKLVAKTAQVDRVEGMVTDVAANFLLRADMVSSYLEWKLDKYSGKTNSDSPLPTIIVRVVGEPDRVNKLSKLSDSMQSDFGQLPPDPRYIIGDTFSPKDLYTDNPYFEFIISTISLPNLPTYYGYKAIKGSQKVSFLKYMLKDEGISVGDSKIRVPDHFKLPEAKVATYEYVSEQGEKIVFGHAVVQLRGNAKDHGVWDARGPLQVYPGKVAYQSLLFNGNVNNYTMDITTDIMPNYTSGSHYGAGEASTLYYVNGYTRAFMEKSVEYNFLGWGDVIGNKTPVLKVSGTSNIDTVTKMSEYGKLLNQVILWHAFGDFTKFDYSQPYGLGSSSYEVEVSSSSKWEANHSIIFGVELVTEASWNATRSTPYPSKTGYKGTTSADISQVQLVLK